MRGFVITFTHQALSAIGAAPMCVVICQEQAEVREALKDSFSVNDPAAAALGNLVRAGAYRVREIDLTKPGVY